MLQETLFLIQFIGICIILIIQMLDLMNVGKTFEIKYNFAMLAIFLILYFTGKVITILNAEELIYPTILNLEWNFLILNSALFLGKLFFYVKDSGFILKKDQRMEPETTYR